MRAVDLIERKRDGGELEEPEIRYLIDGFTRGVIPDYQMSAFLMAVFQKGMSTGEAVAMTRSMIDSGETVSFPAIRKYKVDKHSTGGVGDKTTIVLAPLLASFGLAVPKLSGRGLGHTGGTLDKLESIPGFRTDLDAAEFTRIVSEVGVAVAGATANLVPADRKMYALRDVTATVESTPLIAASILSKKLAVENDALVVDIKIGDGAFFRDREQAQAFADLAVQIGRELGREVSPVLTAMDQPLGSAVGNALEVGEAAVTLRGAGPSDLVEVVVALAARLLAAHDASIGLEGARARAREQLASGRAWETFLRWVRAQGGDPAAVENPERLPHAAHQLEVRAPAGGHVCTLGARAVGQLAMALGAGRERKEDQIDPAAGIVLKAKIGDRVEAGQVLAVLHSNRSIDEERCSRRLLAAIKLTQEEIGRPATVVQA